MQMVRNHIEIGKTDRVFISNMKSIDQIHQSSLLKCRFSRFPRNHTWLGFRPEYSLICLATFVRHTAVCTF